MTRGAHAKRAVSTMLAVAAGGALGAVLRVVAVEVVTALALPAWLAIAGVNTLGGLAIGSVFVHLEARYRDHERSRLGAAPHAARVERKGWRLDVDLEMTLDPVELFRADTRVRLWSGFLVTGVLGGFTTFSTFVVGMLERHGEVTFASFASTFFVGACVPVVATWLGLQLGEVTLPDRSGSSG